MPMKYEPIRFTSAVDWWDQYRIFLSCRPKWLKGGRETSHISFYQRFEKAIHKLVKNSFMVEHKKKQPLHIWTYRHIHTLIIIIIIMLGEVCSCQSNKPFQKKRINLKYTTEWTYNSIDNGKIITDGTVYGRNNSQTYKSTQSK